ncbi:MAG: hypothetical protein OXD43_07735 [Bacteroidetes bacterium]|nr:hypothetical protein [Bacteroidota bacterium]
MSRCSTKIVAVPEAVANAAIIVAIPKLAGTTFSVESTTVTEGSTLDQSIAASVTDDPSWPWTIALSERSHHASQSSLSSDLSYPAPRWCITEICNSELESLLPY